MKQVSVISAVPLHDFVVAVEFSDGTSSEIDLEHYLHGPIFEPIRNDPKIFRAIRIEGRTVSWENGADIDPYTLYYDLTPAWTEEDDELVDMLASYKARRENSDNLKIPLHEIKSNLEIR
ncbi:MAG: DUF2442 domain-containing protein [Pyrinomonadaceae bacterium]